MKEKIQSETTLLFSYLQICLNLPLDDDEKVASEVMKLIMVILVLMVILVILMIMVIMVILVIMVIILIFIELVIITVD